MPNAPTDASTECPYLECGDPRCEDRFRVGRLDEFFAVCCGQYRRCATYQRIRHERGESVVARPAVEPVALTAHGQRIDELRDRRLLPLLP
jgi:hypothetical protein